MMLGEELRDAVGPGKGNHPNDVRLVQRLLDRNAGLVGRTITLTGEFDAATEVAILDFQRKVMRQAFPSGIISPGDETFWRLVETRPRRMLAGALGGIILAPFTGDPDFREDDFKDAAKSLGCEARSIKAVKAVESPFGPFDKAGRPTILFERHLFSQLTLRRYDGRYPMISNRLPGGYSFPERDQYVRLQQAYALNADAALKAASWGGFQILGMNHLAAGYRTVDQFVRAMCQSAVLQKDAFSFLLSKRTQGFLGESARRTGHSLPGTTMALHMLRTDMIQDWRKSMRMPRNNRFALVVSLFVFWASASASAAQSKLLPPATGELIAIEKRLDPKMLPDGATQLKIESKQVFNLVIRDAVQLTLAPVKFRVPVEGSSQETSHDCGVYLLAADGEVDFIRPLAGDLPIQCWSIDAVRLERIPGGQPSIVLTGNLSTGSRTWLQSFVLRWDKEMRKYKMDTVDFK